MRLLPKCVALCAGAAAVIAIAGCGPDSISGIRPAANASGVASAPGSAVSALPTGGTTEALDTSPTTSTSGATSVTASSQTPTALSIVMTLPVHHPAQTTAVIAGRLSQPSNGGAPLPGRLVWLERLGAGGWLLFRAEVTGPDGRVAFGVHVVVGALFRLVYAGTPTLARSVSTVRVVTV
jgi:hypothetical protein